MKTEGVTLTQEAPNTYARGGVIFMGTEATEIEEQQQKQREEEQGNQAKKTDDNPEVTRKAHEKAQALKNELKANLEKVAQGEPIPDTAEGISQLLLKNSNKFTPEQIHKWLQKFSQLIDDGDLRSDRDLRRLRREYRKIQEVLIQLDPQAEEAIQGKTGSFNEQLLTQFGEYLGIKVKPDLAEGSRVDTTSDGVETLHVAENTPLEKLVEIARQLHPEQFTSESQSNMVQFGKDLQRAAVWMDRQVFSSDVVKKLYTAGVRLQESLDPSREKLSDRQIEGNLRQDVLNVLRLSEQEATQGFVNIIMGRHTLSSERTHENLYDVYFRRWQQQWSEEQVFGEDKEYKRLQDELKGLLEEKYRLEKEENPDKARLELLDQQRKSKLDEISEKREPHLAELRSKREELQAKPLAERQKLYEEYLAKSGTQENLARWVKRFIEKADTSGRLGRLGARAVESKLQQDMLQGMVAKWQKDIAETEGGRKLFDRAHEIATGSTQDRLERVNRLFQPGQKAELLQYVPSDIKNLLATGEDFSRTEAACAIATAYEKHVLEQMGFTVYTDLSGAHSTLLVIEGNSAYRVDPNTIYDENRSTNLLAVVQIGDNEFGQLQSQLQQLSSNPNGTLRIKDTKGKLHVIGGDNLVTSEYIGNLAALRVDKNGKFRNGYLEAMLPNASPQELQELRFALAKKAVDIAPDNYVAWAQMWKFANDGRKDEYMNYANSLNEDGVKEALSKELLVGLRSLRQTKFVDIERNPAAPNANVVYGEHYGVGSNISDAISEFAGGNVTVAMDIIERLISADVKNHQYGEYVAIVNNIIFAIEEKIDAAATDQEKATWRHLAHFTFDYSYERLIGGNDDTLKQGWRQPAGLYTPQSLENIKDLASVFDQDQLGATDDSTYLSVLVEQRQNVHTVFKDLNNKELFKNAAKSLGESALTFLEEEIPGAAEVQAIYEKVLNQQPAERDQWSDTNTFKEYADSIVRGSPNSDNPNANLGLLRDMGLVDQKSGFKLRPWQIIRAGTVGLQMSAISQRRMVYGALGDVPSVNDVPALVASMAGDGNITALGGAMKLTVARYFFEPNARVFVDGVVKAARAKGARGRQFGLRMGGDLIVNKADLKDVVGTVNGVVIPEWKGLWGQSEMSYALMDVMGGQDPKSMRWVAEYTYLDRNDYRHYTISETDFHGVSNEFLQSFRQKFGSQVIDRNGSPKQLTLKEYLDMQKLIAQEQVGGGDFDSPGVKEQFNKNIQRIVRNQRLFLGALLHYNYSVTGDSPLSDQTKAIIWDTVADLMPSKFAAYLPKEAKNIMAQQMFGKAAYTKDGEQNVGVGGRQLTAAEFGQLEAAWELMLKKLWIAEQARVREDSIILNAELSPAEKVRRLGRNTLDHKDLQYYLNSTAILQDPLQPNGPRIPVTALENAVIGEIRDLGKKYVAQNADGTPVTGWRNGTRQGTEFAGGFARMNFIFTPFLDDAPSTKWSRLPDKNTERVLVGTQDALDKANDALTGFVSDPIKKPADVIEPLKNALLGLQDPHGTYDAQTLLMGWVESYLELATETWGGKHFGIVMKLFRRGRSKLEKHNLQANIALAETETAEFLGALAQNQIINDDPSHKLATGRTMYKELRKKYKADWVHVALGFLRIFTMLFGTAIALELLKAFLPEEVGKQLG